MFKNYNDERVGMFVARQCIAIKHSLRKRDKNYTTESQRIRTWTEEWLVKLGLHVPELPQNHNDPAPQQVSAQVHTAQATGEPDHAPVGAANYDAPPPTYSSIAPACRGYGTKYHHKVHPHHQTTAQVIERMQKDGIPASDLREGLQKIEDENRREEERRRRKSSDDSGYCS